MYEQHIVVDLEMTHWSRSKHPNMDLHREVIQIGAVKLNENYEVIDTFFYPVKPQLCKEINIHVTELTGIHIAHLSLADNFQVGLKQFENWIGYEKNTRIYSWSNNDLRQFQKECEYKEIEFPKNMKRWLDLQKIYPRIMQFSRRRRKIKLETATQELCIDMKPGNAHNALYDAQITADILVSIATGEYKAQADLLNATINDEADTFSLPLGEICGGVLQNLLKEMEETK